MSPRYYLFTTLLVAVLTLAVSWWKQKQTGREMFLVMLKVVSVIAIIVGVIVGVAHVFTYLGIAQSGFLL